MPVTITMPALSPTMEEGNLVKWFVSEGDKVLSGEIIAEIETDKATMEVESVEEGIISKILVPDGTIGVKVNSAIAFLVEEGEKLSDVPSSEEKKISAQQEQDVLSVSYPKSKEALVLSSAAFEKKKDITKVGSCIRTGRVFSSPLARRLAQRVGIDLALISGTGSYGRIVKRDIDAAIERGMASSVEKQKSQNSLADIVLEEKNVGVAFLKSSNSDAADLNLFSSEEYQIVSHDTMRKTIARRLVESKQTVPHFYITVDCELDALLALRTNLNAAAFQKKTQNRTVPFYKISVNDMVIKAVALALNRVPDANVSWLEQGTLHHQHVDVGVAVSIPGGVITPVVRRADEKSLHIISNEMKDFVNRACQRKLKPEEYSGGSTAVSNMGMYAVKEFSAIINSPQATIFAVGAGEKRVIVRQGEPCVATIMSVTVSADHRVIDGALAAELTQHFKQLIENPFSIVA